MYRKRPISLLLCLMLIPLWSISQVNNKGININNNGNQQFSGETYGLIIGISKYQNIPGLTFADADAVHFYQYLTSPAGGNIDSSHIKLFINEKATAGNIVTEGLDWLLEVAKEGDNVIIYFSGHGDFETKTTVKNGFLLASDAPKSCYMAGGTIGIYYLQTYLNTLVERNNARVIMISDACKSGKLAGGIDGATTTTLALQQQWSNVIKILSSQAGELSQEGAKWGNGAGVFSYYLLNGLTGLADMNHDKKVTLMEIFVYLAENVARETNNTQNPSIVGNQSSVLAYVDSLTLASLEKSLRANGQGEGQLAMKGFNDNVLNMLDPGVRTLYEKFQLCISHNYLLEGPDSTGYAWDYYLQLSKDPGAESIINSVRRSLLAALQNKSQIAINTWVKGEDIPDTISTYTAYKELYYAMQLIDSSYIMYDYIKARYLFWKSVYTDDIKEKLAIMEECAAIEPNAPFVFQQLGSICLNNDDYRSAIKYYRQAIALAPGWTYPVNDLGVTYDNMSMADSAMWYYRYAVQIDPTYALSYNNLANEYITLGMYDSALVLIDKAIGYNPEKALYYVTKGIIFRDKEMYDQSLLLLKEAISKDPDANTYYQLGLTYQNMDDYASSVTAFKEAIVRDETIAKYHRELGRTYYYMDKYERARMELDIAISLAPDKDDSYALYGLSYMYEGNYTDAVKYLDKAISLDSNDAYNWRMLSRVYRYKGDYDKAIECSRVSVVKDSVNKWNWYYLSLAQNYGGYYKDALVTAKKTLSMDTAYADFQKNLAEVYNRNGEYQLSIYHYNKALKLAPDVASTYQDLAYVYEADNQNDKAEQAFLKAISLDPKNAARLVALADFYRDKTKDYSSAESWLAKAVALDPANYLIYEGYGYLYLRMGNYKKAEENFQKAIETAPEVAWNYYNLACFYSLTGNSKKALQWLEKSFIKGMNNTEHMKTDHDLDPIRSEPAFKSLFKKYFNIDL
jgi:tetratricopeptide (TPR) repeat protein